tara:strand:- start:326 stop:925 length:600 start_codon:yes stop_codon:yes gene_type:complete
MLAIKTVKYYVKPAVFLLGLMPLLLVIGDLFEITGTLGANPIENMQDRFGIWGLRFIVTVLMISPLRSITGFAWITQFRRMIGLYAFFYVLMHFLVWLLLEQNLLMAAIIEDIATRPFITIGFIALLILVALASTSTMNIRKKMGNNWVRLHSSIYLASILGVWHFWWQVKKDITEPLIYAIIISILLLYRLRKKYSYT